MARISARTTGLLVLATFAGGFAILVSLASSDSPVEVCGGSIYMKIAPGQKWTEGADEQHYTAPMPANPGELHTKGVDTAAASIPDLKGWVITLSSRDKGKSEKQDQVTICSDSTCSGASFDSVTYFNTKPDSRWTVDTNTNQLRFHDKACDGGSGPGEDRTCDFLFRATIESPKGTKLPSGLCERWYGAGHCKIGIGPPQ